ncbi:MAG: pyridoxal phosphate-dependent aminotransferase [Elusimicrobia bacterium]|nr:pyridoxal phosphate-dependent aminotransferase [Elusimicrobiota bacterium]
MKYDFDEIIQRRSTASVKWDFTSDDSIIPLWVADMDFKAAPPIINALKKRAEHGVFGYALPPAGYYEAVCRWFKNKHGLQIRPGWILPTTGVVAALSTIIKALCGPEDKVIIQTPVYNCFFSVIENNSCQILKNPLIYESASYRIDFEDLRKKAADPHAKVMILCNPHNPAGRVWSKSELEQIGEICRKNKVTVLADEIHCELTRPGFKYTPFASLNEDFLLNSVTCTSPSKAFNLAGLQTANIFCADKEMRSKIERALHINETASVGPFGIDALITAYDECADWLEELNSYLDGNYLTLKSFFEKEMPDFPLTPLEGTYLAWVNCRKLKKSSLEIAETLLKHGVRINPGYIYGEDGEGFIRINTACPRALLIEGLKRIKKAFRESF